MDPRKPPTNEDTIVPETTPDPRCEDEGEHERIALSQEGNSVMDDFRGSKDDPLEKEPLNEENPQTGEPLR